MSKIFVIFVVFFAVAVFVEQAAGARDQQRQEQKQEEAEAGRGRFRRQVMTSTLGDYPLEDVNLLQPLFRTPLKRQWCRRGMAYNPALGTCTFSVAAMRGRGRNNRRH